MESVLDLPAAYGSLSEEQRRRFDAILSFRLDRGTLVVPESMKPWADKQFGSSEALESQRILRVTNKVSCEGALFNELRARRPMQKGAPIDKGDLKAAADKEPFHDLKATTPLDVFGRIRNRHETTTANVAKADVHHGVVVFDNWDPLAFTEEETVSHFEAAIAWIGAAHLNDREAVYPAIGWNCLWKAAASLVHGHMQVLLSKEPYGATMAYERLAERYAGPLGASYWDDLFLLHKDLGLGARFGNEGNVRVFAHLTPKKEKEIVILADSASIDLFAAVHRSVAALRDDLGVESFNVAMLFPRLRSAERPVPIVTRIVDRGSLSSRSTDFAFVELYLGHSVVSSDPAKVAQAVLRRLQGNP